MPLSKRVVYDATLYGPPDLFEESQPDTILRDTAMSATIGAIHQISYLSLYAVEIFDNLMRLSEDVGDRIQNATLRANHVLSNLSTVEKRIHTCDILAPRRKQQKFKSRRAFMPSILTKKTNASQILAQYNACNLPPQLWKMESVIPEDCLIRYSHPGFFFQEWLNVELKRQEAAKRERKRAKEERKKLKEERRRRRRQEEEAAVAKVQAIQHRKSIHEIPPEVPEEPPTSPPPPPRKPPPPPRSAAALFQPVGDESPPASPPPPTVIKPSNVPPPQKPPKPVDLPPLPVSPVASPLLSPPVSPPMSPPASPPPEEPPLSPTEEPSVDEPPFDDLPDDLPPVDDIPVDEPSDALDAPPDSPLDMEEPPPDDIPPPEEKDPSPRESFIRAKSSSNASRRRSSVSAVLERSMSIADVLRRPSDTSDTAAAALDMYSAIGGDDDMLLRMASKKTKKMSVSYMAPSVDADTPPPLPSSQPPQLPTAKPPLGRRKSLLSMKPASFRIPDNDDDIYANAFDVRSSIASDSKSSDVPNRNSSILSRRASTSSRSPSIREAPSILRPDLRSSVSSVRASEIFGEPVEPPPDEPEPEAEADINAYYDTSAYPQESYSYDPNLSYEYDYNTGQYYAVDPNAQYNTQTYQEDSYPTNYVTEDAPTEPPPPEEPKLPQSALFSVLGQIKTGKTLKKIEAVEKPKDARTTMLDNIKLGSVALKKVVVKSVDKVEQRHEAIAAILSNRAKIAGSDSDSDDDDSDSDFSDDDYF